MILAMMGWGLVWPLSKFMINFGTPQQIACLRFLIVSVCFVPLLVYLKIPFKIPKNVLMPTFLTGILNAIYSYLMYVGMQYGDAGSAGVITEVLAPIMAAFLWVAIKHQSLSKNEKWGLFLGVVSGTFLIDIFHNVYALLSLFNVIYLLAALDWAFLMIASRYATESINAISLNFYASLITFVLFCPHLLDVEQMNVFRAGWEFWLALLVSCVFCTVFSTTIFYNALFVLGVTKGGMYALLVPLFALFFSWVLLGEIPRWHTIIGGILAILAIYIINHLKLSKFA